MSHQNNSRKVLKRLMVSFLVVVCVVFLTHLFSYKNRIFGMVQRHTDILNHSVQSTSYDEAYKIKGVKRISVFNTSDGNLFIDYYCYGFGLVPSSFYYGFYYSGDGEPTGYQGGDLELVKKGNGWTWSEKSGDNRYYTEPILENWYYYKAGF